METMRKIMTFAVLFLFALGSEAQNIQEPAAILVRPPASSNTLASQPLRLTCVAYGIPTPTVTWTTTDGRNFNQETMAGGASTDNVRIVSRNVTINGTVFLVSVLEVCATDASYSKTYRCSASNGVSGEAVAASSAEFSVTVITEPPAIVVRPPSNYSVDVNGTVQLVCVAYGIPVPTITWSRPGCSNISSTLVDGRVSIFSESMKVENTSFHKSALQLCNVVAGDASSYTCTADNGIGGNGISSSTFSSSIEVNPIQEPPEPSSPSPESSSPSRPTVDLTNQPAAAGSSVSLIVASIEGFIILSLLLILIIVVVVACSEINKKKKIIISQKEQFFDTHPTDKIETTAFTGVSSEPIIVKSCEAYGEIGRSGAEVEMDNIYEHMADTCSDTT